MLKLNKLDYHNPLVNKEWLIVINPDLKTNLEKLTKKSGQIRHKTDGYEYYIGLNREKIKVVWSKDVDFYELYNKITLI